MSQDTEIFSEAEQGALVQVLRQLHGGQDDLAKHAAVNKVVEQLAGIAFFNPKCLLNPDGTMKDLKDLPDEVAIAIQSLEVTYSESRERDGEFDRVKSVNVRPCDKLKALALLMKCLDMT